MPIFPMGIQYVDGMAPKARPKGPGRLEQYSDTAGLPAPQPPVQLDVGPVEQGVQLDIGPIETVISMALQSRAQAQLQKAAEADAAFKQQLASRQSLARAGLPAWAGGGGRPTMPAHVPTSEDPNAGHGYVPRTTGDPLSIAGRIAGHGGRVGPQDFNGMSVAEAAETMGYVPFQMDSQDLDARAAQTIQSSEDEQWRGVAPGHLPHIIPSLDTVSERDLMGAYGAQMPAGGTFPDMGTHPDALRLPAAGARPDMRLPVQPRPTDDTHYPYENSAVVDSDELPWWMRGLQQY
jgi:hypothetical protein